MTVKADEFFRAISDAKFDRFIEGREEEFGKFVRDRLSENRAKIVIRFVFEVDEPDVFVPYYIWAIYYMEGEDQLGTLELIPPDFSDPDTYLEVPEELEGEPYFEITIDR